MNKHTFVITVKLFSAYQGMLAFKKDDHPFDAQVADKAHHNHALYET